MLGDTKAYRNKPREAGLSTCLPDQGCDGAKGGISPGLGDGKQTGGQHEANVVCGVPQGSLLFREFRSDGEESKLSSMAKPGPDCEELQEDLTVLCDLTIK